MQQELSSNQSYVLLSDLANELKIPAYRLRSWEVLYPFIKSFRDSTGRRFYDKKTVEIFREISRLLYQEGRKNTEIFTIISHRFSSDLALKAQDSETVSLKQEDIESSPLLNLEKTANSLKEREANFSEENKALKEGLNNLLNSLKKLGETIVSQEKV
ncbi:MerR family transcriptional regulator [Acetobacteraceae bacterium]|nr:MerR family transcriptional regulator [Acetobacteraceae bacterium]